MKKIGIFLSMWFLLTGLALTAPPGDSREMTRLFEEGKKASAAADYATALAKYQAALALAKKLGLRQQEGDILRSIGEVYHDDLQDERALEHYQQALAIMREVRNLKGELNTLIRITRIYLFLGQGERATEYLEQISALEKDLEKARLKQDQQDPAPSPSKDQEMARLFEEGVKASASRDYAMALAKYQEALALAKNLGQRQGEGFILSFIGTVYQDMGQPERALEHYQQALAIVREVKDRKGEGVILINIGEVLKALDKRDRALEHYQQAVTIMREIKDRKFEGVALMKIGMIYGYLGQYDRALEHYQQALPIMREVEDRQGEGVTLSSIGVVYEALGQYDRAIEHCRQALAINREVEDRKGEGDTLNNIGGVYEALGQYDQALEHYQQALAIRREVKDREGEGTTLSDIGLVYSRLGQADRALEHCRQALAIKREVKDHKGEGDTFSGIGRIYEALGQYDRALEHYQQALAIKREVKDRKGEGALLSNIGVAYSYLSQYDQALKHSQLALAVAEEVGFLEGKWAGHFLLGVVHGKQGHGQEAVAHYNQALDIIETLRGGVQEKESRLSFMQNKLMVYDNFIELLVSLHKQDPSKGYDKKALEIFERKQGRQFLEEMGKSGARGFAGLPEEVRMRESGLETQVESGQALLVKTRSQKDPDPQQIRELEARLQQTKDQLQGLKAKIEKDYPDYHALKYPRPATLKELQEKVLKTGEVLLVYGVMEKSTCLWLVSPKEFSLHSVHIGENDLHQKISSFRRGVRQAQPEAPDLRLGRELYQLLLPEKVRRSLTPGQLLYFVPTGPLYALPFETLETQGPKQPRRYLVQDHPVAYLSSASLLKVLREAQARKKEQPAYPFLAFAHPVYTKTGPAVEDASLRGLQHRVYRDQAGGEFSELPETADEVKEIQQILKAPEASEPLNLRERAARSRVRALHQEKRLAGYRYVVFASHGFLPGQVTGLVQPALALSYPEREGFLTMGDIFGLRLNADLVTLSACNTGRGTPVKGEGILGLTRAFMYAGTPAVGVTLWSVETESAKDLNVGMHRYLSQGLGRAEALRRIKLAMVQGEKEFEGKDYRHPFFWAPLVVFGDGQ